MPHSLTKTIGTLLSPSGKRARLAVFCFHQVLDRPDPLHPSEPDVPAFTHDIELIASIFNVLPLPAAARALKEGTLPARAACITFDDGYKNNHTLAAPVLEQKGMPATFFVAGGAVDRGVMWNDLIIEAVRQSGQGTITDDLGGFTSRAGLKSGTRQMLQEILDYLKYQPVSERWDRAEQFYRRNAGDELPRLMMERPDVADLAQRGFDIGGHTIHHPILKELDAEEARAEIAGCYDWITEVTGQAPFTFAYPNGIPGRDFDSEHTEMVAEAGFKMAASTVWALARPDSDQYRIPRIGPWWRQGKGLVSGLARNWLHSYF